MSREVLKRRYGLQASRSGEIKLVRASKSDREEYKLSTGYRRVSSIKKWPFPMPRAINFVELTPTARAERGCKKSVEGIRWRA